MSINELIDKADKGDSDSQLAVGRAYYLGEEIFEDLKKAEFYLRKALESHPTEARYYLTLIEGDEKGYNKPKDAFMSLMKMAESGFAKAQCAVGEYYEDGWGTEKNLEKAFEWYKRSADQQYSWGQYRLGLFYYYGDETNKNVKQALELFAKAANAGEVEAQAMLGSCYLNEDGVPKNPKLAFCWSKKAAEAGHFGAEFNLALMYESGDGVERSHQKAADLFRKSADQGYDEAQRSLGVYYLYGLNLPPDREEACKWFQLSANQGNAEAKRCLNHIIESRAKLEPIRKHVEPHCFKVAQLLLQIPRSIDSSTDSILWRYLKKGQRPSKKEANKFLLTCVLDYHKDVNSVWDNTQDFVEKKLGDPEDLWGTILRHSLEQWMGKKKDYGLHYLSKAHERVWKIGRDVSESYDGDARNVWEGQAPAVVLQRLHQLGDGKFGVGEMIANMIVGALIDTEQIEGTGDVKADTHVRKILGRVFKGDGFKANQAKECTEFARKIYPPNPWLLDQPLFLLGQQTCNEKAPDCPNCYLRQECLYYNK